MVHVYAIKSISHNYIYVGITDNPERRIAYHNKGDNKTTRAYAPFSIILIENYDTRPAARKREIELKTGNGKAFLKKLTLEQEYQLQKQ